MSSPANYLPSPISEDAINSLLRNIGLPSASIITSPKATAQYHSIYFLTISPCEKSYGYSELVLRVSGDHLPKMKTSNEVGVMAWLSMNTKIPIPSLIAYDASVANPIHHEYTLLSRVHGATLSDIYDALDDGQITLIIDQLIDFLTQLKSHQWDGIGGLNLDKDGRAVLARVVDETFWQSADITEYWPAGETVSSLNIKGPFQSYVELVTVQVLTYVRLIRIHTSLEFMRDTIPRLEAFVEVLPRHEDVLNLVPLILAHKDLHFGNILFDASAGKITAILDWEFSGVVPYPKWNPGRSFLWNGRDDAKSFDEKQRIFAMFMERCSEKGVTLLAGAEYSSPLQENMQKVADYLRAIVEVSPRGQRQDLVQDWKGTVMESIAQFGV